MKSNINTALLFYSSCIFTQVEANIWCFGENVGFMLVHETNPHFNFS